MKAIRNIVLLINLILNFIFVDARNLALRSDTEKHQVKLQTAHRPPQYNNEIEMVDMSKTPRSLGAVIKGSGGSVGVGPKPNPFPYLPDAKVDVLGTEVSTSAAIGVPPAPAIPESVGFGDLTPALHRLNYCVKTPITYYAFESDGNELYKDKHECNCGVTMSTDVLFLSLADGTFKVCTTPSVTLISAGKPGEPVYLVKSGGRLLINKVLAAAQEFINIEDNKFELNVLRERVLCYDHFNVEPAMIIGDPCISSAFSLGYDGGLHHVKMQASFRSAFYFMLAAVNFDAAFKTSVLAVSTGGASLIPNDPKIKQAVEKISGVYGSIKKLLFKDVLGGSLEYEQFYSDSNESRYMQEGIACISLAEAIYMRKNIPQIACVGIVDKVAIPGCKGNVLCDYNDINSNLNAQEIKPKVIEPLNGGDPVATAAEN